MPDIQTMVTPVHSCGCQGKPQRNNAAGQAMAAAFALVECFTCQRTTGYEAAVRMAETLQLPDLDGSREVSRRGSSQYSYSMTVRETIRQRLDEAYPDPAPADRACADAVLYGITDSSWWLDRKDAEAYAVLEWVRPIVQIVSVQ
jgi:hypothetical protein